MYAKIQPISVGWPGKTADCLRVSNVRINSIGADGSADVAWQLYTDGAGSVVEGVASLGGLMYDAWGLDDAYLLEWLANPAQLALTIVEIVRDASTEDSAPVDAEAPTEPPADT